jgi:exonuclease SbcC
MEIVLNKLSLLNFKGIRSLDINLSPVTNIYGENGLGKTTIFDAFLWLLFGKDSSDRKDFEIKTLDAQNRPISKLDHEVSAILYVDGQRMELRRVYREKWEKKRGTTTSEMTGHEQEFYWNDVPMKAGDYAKKVSELMNENLFKLITNPFAFNSLKWQDRRQTLMTLAGGITPEDVLFNLAGDSKAPAYEELRLMLNSGKSLAEFKTQLAAQKKKLRDQLQMIPARVDEATRAIPEALDFPGIRMHITAKEKAIAEIDEQLQSANGAAQSQMKAFNERQAQIMQLRSSLDRMRFEVEAAAKNERRENERKLEEFRGRIRDAESDAHRLEELLTFNTTRRTAVGHQLGTLRTQWTEVNAEQLTFEPGQFNCPACGSEFAPELIEQKKEELTARFNKDKDRRLASITQQAATLKQELKGLEEGAEDLSTRLAGTQQTLQLHSDAYNSLLEHHNHEYTAETPEAIQAALAAKPEYLAQKQELETLEAAQKGAQQAPAADNSTLKQEKATLIQQFDALKRELATEDQIRSGHNRVRQLQEDERDLAQQLADLEGKEYLVDQYNRAAMDLLEERINGKFKTVHFKLFAQQINGGEVECCETLINGVPWSDANNAARVNAGIDIINALCKHYGVSAPIFIDNRESVNNLMECASQIINLIVSQDKKLKVA